MSACISRRLRQPSAAASGRWAKAKLAASSQSSSLSIASATAGSGADSLSPRAKPVFIALQPLRLPLRQLAPCRGQRIEGHRRIAAAAGLAMGTQPYEGKAAALPEAPQLSGIAEADGEIVIASGIGRRYRRSSSARGLPRWRVGWTAIRLTRSPRSVAARGLPPCAASDWATRFPRGRRKPAHTARLSSRESPPSATSHRGARYRAAGASAAESPARSIHHAPQIERGSSVMRPGQ